MKMHDDADNVNMIAKFSLAAKNIRTVKEAKIDLNGVTVLAGENDPCALQP